MNENETLKSSTERILAGAGILVITVGSFAVSYFNPVTAGFFPQCPFHQLTGLNCPGCGLTRGFHALFHGDILGALHYNAMLPVYVFLIGYMLVSMFLIAVRGRGLSWKIFPPSAMYAFMIVTIIFSVARNLPFYPFNLLAI